MFLTVEELAEKTIVVATTDNVIFPQLRRCLVDFLSQLWRRVQRGLNVQLPHEYPDGPLPKVRSCFREDPMGREARDQAKVGSWRLEAKALMNVRLARNDLDAVIRGIKLLLFGCSR